MSKVYEANDKLYAKKRIVCGEIIDFNMDNLRYYKISNNPNVRIEFDRNTEQRVVRIYALKDIQADEQLFSQDIIVAF
jgi:SET domain-containing protein